VKPSDSLEEHEIFIIVESLLFSFPFLREVLDEFLLDLCLREARTRVKAGGDSNTIQKQAEQKTNDLTEAGLESQLNYIFAEYSGLKFLKHLTKAALYSMEKSRISS